MSLLAQQVAALTKAYRPPTPRRGTGRVHVIADDPEMIKEISDGPFVCNACGKLKHAEDYYLNRTRGERQGRCKECVCAAKKARRIAEKEAV